MDLTFQQVKDFLQHLENNRMNHIRTRNHRRNYGTLTSISLRSLLNGITAKRQRQYRLGNMKKIRELIYSEGLARMRV